MIFVQSFLWFVWWAVVSLAAPFLFVMLPAARLACLARLERVASMKRTHLVLLVVTVLDLLHAVFRTVLYISLPASIRLDPYLPPIDAADAVLKLVGVAACVAAARSRPTLLIVGLGLSLDVLITIRRVMDGGQLVEEKLAELAAWAVVFFALGRVAREIRTEELRSYSEVPLWRRWREEGVSPSVSPEEIR